MKIFLLTLLNNLNTIIEKILILRPDKSLKLNIMFVFNFKTFFKAYIFILFALSNNLVFAQTYNFNNKEEVIKRLHHDISALAHDSMQGREAGTIYEKMAYNYIISRYKEIGLQTILPNNSYLQSFEFEEGFKVKDSTFLKINNIEYELNTDYFPTHYTTNKEVSGELVFVGYGISAPKLQYDDYEAKNNLKGKIFVMEISNPDGFSSQKYRKYNQIDKRIKLAKTKGAIAVILINTDTICPDLYNETDLETYDLEVPVIFMNKKHASMLKNSDGVKLNLRTSIELSKKIAFNVVGYIDNKAEKTIVIGAHYDHFGMGNFDEIYQGFPTILNGANDNASGIAGLLELARYFKYNKIKRNILFIAFSAEEKGSLGSYYFIKNKVFDISKIDYMINLDQIGRIDKNIDIVGVGTTPIWDTLIKQIEIENIQENTTKSGVVGSDIKWFCVYSVPVLHFGSTAYEDYHKPTDDYEKINFDGAYLILNSVKKLIEATDTINKFPFLTSGKFPYFLSKNSRKSLHYNIQYLHIIPDYRFEGKGLRIEDVFNKEKLQIQFNGGDIIVKINSTNVIDIESFLQILNNFKKGEKVKFYVLRNDNILEFEITL